MKKAILAFAVLFLLCRTASAQTAAVSFVGIDTATSGHWTGTYGTDGYAIEGAVSVLPAYATLTETGAATWPWNPATSDPRALNNTATTWYSGSSFSFNVNFSDGRAHQVSIYAVDWDSSARSETISILSGSVVLDTRTISNFGNGVWLSWNISGNASIKVTSVSGANAVVSGVFFGAKPGTVVTVPPVPPIPPGCPAVPHSATLYWFATAGTTYTISRATTATGTPQVLASGLTTGPYEDLAVTAGSRYWYSISAVVGGVSSPVSPQMAVKITSP